MRIGVPHQLARARGAIASHGPRATLELAAGRAAARAYLHEEHVWYELALTADRPRRPLPDGIDVRRAGRDDLELVAALGQSTVRAAEYLNDGHDGWLAVDGQAPAFMCWIFRRRAPVLAAPGGWLELPPSSVCLEDSVTASTHRGRGLAPAVWDRLARQLAGEGARSMITKVTTDNTPSRKAVLKAGFVEVATMRLRRIGTLKRVELKPLDDGIGRELERRLAL